MMRAQLSKNIFSFVERREKEMAPHRERRGWVIGELTNIVHSLWSEARVEVQILVKLAANIWHITFASLKF